MEPHPFPYGPGPYDGSPWEPLAHAAGALTLLFWPGLLGLLAWAVMRWANRRSRLAAESVAPAVPSAVELLRQRFAMGEIDAVTFEAMLERIMASEARERAQWQPRGGAASRFQTGPLWTESEDPTELLDPDAPAHGSE